MNILSIGGSDPSSGAGIQGDVKTCQQLGSYCLTAVTAVTNQNTSTYASTHAVPPRVIRGQIESVMSDCRVDAVKIGMVYDAAAAGAIHDVLRSARIPVVVDPVMTSTTGGTLLKRDALREYRRRIVPLADVITPNAAEAEAVAGGGCAAARGERARVEDAAGAILGMGAGGVVVTGIAEGDTVSDHVRTESISRWMTSRRIRRAESHGGGCAFATALAVSLAGGGAGTGIVDAARFAGRFAKRSIVGARRIGAGIGVTGGGPQDATVGALAGGITGLAGIKNIGDAIPECQTNFVYAKRNPAGGADVAGLAGRIVRAGGGVIVAGDIRYGGSRHVAAAVLAVNARFSEIRSAANIRYDKAVIGRMTAAGYRVASYDRGREPRRVRDAEGASVPWGVGSAISGARRAPDAVFHTGGHGKEPMILVFGRTPREVTAKIRVALGGRRTRAGRPRMRTPKGSGRRVP